jgi:hypothetical protein
MAAAPEIAVPLRAGPLRLVFDRGELRWIRLGEREVLRGVYFALRAQSWVRVGSVLEDLEIEAEPASFRLRFRARNDRGPVRFAWEGHISGGPDGRIVFAVRGAAESSFLRNRIGLCVLHPAEACAGRRCIVEHVDGDRVEGVFPALIAPHQPFHNVRAILHEVSPGVEAETRMEGETFETEDQRNWSDASFKTYCTPQHLPFPVRVEPGTRVEQTVTVSLFGLAAPVEEVVATVPGALPKKRNSSQPVVVAVSDQSSALPSIGLAGAERASLSPAALERLRSLRLSHVRADLSLPGAGWVDALACAARNAVSLEAPLELALSLADEPREALRELRQRLGEIGPRLASFLVYSAADRTSPPQLLAAARDVLAPSFQGTPIGGGSDANFAELNRNRPAPGAVDRLALALNPQVHAFDDQTIVENLASLGAIGETLRVFSDGRPLAISPATLRPRLDKSPPSWRAPGEAPFTDDPRQATAFAAAWVLAFLAAAAEAGFASVTLGELAGPRGVQDAGGPFPMLKALSDVAGLPGARVLHARARRPERIQALALRAGEHTRLFLCNVTSDPHPVRVEGLVGRAARSALGESETVESTFELELAPREIVRLDVTG